MDPPLSLFQQQRPQLPAPVATPLQLPLPAVAVAGVEPPPAAAAAAGVAAAAAATADAAALPTLPSGLVPPAAAIKCMAQRCQSCRALRAKCVGGFPCNRCFDLGHTCVPGTGTSAGGTKRRKKRPSDEENGDSAAALTQSPSPMDLAYLSSDPLPFAELYTRACVRVFEEGRCSRGNLVRFLRKWRRESLRVGADVTVGMAKVLQERAGIDPIELVDRDELLYGQTEAARRARLAAEQAAQAGRAREILEWDMFKRASLGGAAAYLICIDEEGRYVDVANPAFQRMMGGAGWPGRHMQAYKMLACYMGASLCAPGDREVLLQALADNCLWDTSESHRMTHVLKMFTGDGSGRGRVGLVIATLERFELEGGSVGLVMRLEPAPPSRHLTMQTPSSESSSTSSLRKRLTGRRHKKGYRQSTLALARAEVATKGEGQQGPGPGAFAFPAMAAVPGGMLPAPAGGGAFIAAAAASLLARQEEKGQAGAAAAVAAGAASVPWTEPNKPPDGREGAAARAAGGGNRAGGALSEAFETGDRGRWAPCHPPVPLAAMKWGGGSDGGVYEGPFSLDSEDWAGFLEDEELVIVEGDAARGLEGSPISMEEVF